MNENRGIWRGKAGDSWAVGYLMKYAGEYQIWQKDEKYGCTNNYIVDEDTLGECSCVPDKNHKLIFEGDVLSNKLPDPELFLCYYCDEEAGFYAKNVRTHSVYMLGALMDMTLFKLKIIGNIHDNPELIQKGAAE